MKFLFLLLFVGCGGEIVVPTQQKVDRNQTSEEDSDGKGDGSAGDGDVVDSGNGDCSDDDVGSDPAGPGDSETDNDPEPPPTVVECAGTILCHKDKLFKMEINDFQEFPFSMCVTNQHAVAAHLNHGDEFGYCDGDKEVGAWHF